MMNSFWIGLVGVFAIIGSIHSQACSWTSCEPRNQVQCPPGYVEKLTARCDPGFPPPSEKKFCCDPLKCAYATGCVLDGCTSCAPCSAGQIYYPEIGAQSCVFDFLNVNYNGKKNWCCNP